MCVRETQRGRERAADKNKLSGTGLDVDKRVVLIKWQLIRVYV